MIYIAGPGHGGPGCSPTRISKARTPSSTRRSPGRGGSAGALPSVLVPRRDPVSRRTRDARFDSRGRRTRLLALHAFGAAFDNPDLLVACVVGDGEAETGPLATSWHSNKFLNPVTDGAVLPILHLNGYKIANPTVLARIPEREPLACSRATAGARLSSSRARRAAGQCISACASRSTSRSTPSVPIQRRRARAERRSAAVADDRPANAEGWTGPKRGRRGAVEGTLRSHQVPVGDASENADTRDSRGVDAELPARRAVRRDGRLRPELTSARPTAIAG